MSTSTGFIQRYFSIWQANPHTISFSSVEHQRSGVSVVLPVSEMTYNAFMQGKISCYEITGKHILAESQFLIFDFLLDYREFEHRRHKVVNSLPFLGFYQLATLSKAPRANDFRSLTFANTAHNIARMKRAGFRKTKSVTLDAKLPLWELSTNDRYFEGSAEAETVAHFIGLKNRILRRSRAKTTLLAMQLCQSMFKKAAIKNAG